MFIGSVVGMLWTIGIQLIRKEPKASKLGIKVFTPLSIFMVGSGIGALATGYHYSEFTPASILFLAIGIGMLIGVFLMRLIILARYKSAL